MQTSVEEIPCYPTTAEEVILYGLYSLQQQVNAKDSLNDGLITLLALHIAEFPCIIPVSTVINREKPPSVKLPLYVIKKVGNNTQTQHFVFNVIT